MADEKARLDYRLEKVGAFGFCKMKTVARILYACGKDMAEKYGLHHWDNPFLKSYAIVVWCSLKNEIYLLYDGDRKAVATFQVRAKDGVLHLCKLATLPSESGRGIGTYCMRAVDDLAAQKGCGKIVLEVYENSAHALAFYEHKGFGTVGTTDTLKYKELIMEKEV